MFQFDTSDPAVLRAAGRVASQGSRLATGAFTEDQVRLYDIQRIYVYLIYTQVQYKTRDFLYFT